VSSLSMAQLGFFGADEAEDVAPPAKPNAIEAYMRAKERVAALQARMSAIAPMPGDTSSNVFVSAPMTVEADPEPLPVRSVSTNGDLAKLALVGVISGLAVWALTRQRRR